MKFIHDITDVFSFLFYQTAFWSYLSSSILVPLGLPLFAIYLIRKKKQFLGIISGKLLFFISLFFSVLWFIPVVRFGGSWFIDILDGRPVETFNYLGNLLNWCLWIIGSLSVCYAGMFVFGFKNIILKILGCLAVVIGVYIYAMYLIMGAFINFGPPP
jgi:hypothetical protein